MKKYLKKKGETKTSKAIKAFEEFVKKAGADYIENEVEAIWLIPKQVGSNKAAISLYINGDWRHGTTCSDNDTFRHAEKGAKWYTGEASWVSKVLDSISEYVPPEKSVLEKI